MRRLIALLSVMLLSAPAFAQFEGVIEMKMTASQGEGRVTVSIAKQGVRNEMDFSMPQGAMKMSILVKAGNSDKAYNINDAAKTYSEIDLKKAEKMAGRAETTYTLKDLGQETVRGYSCRHVLLTSKREGETELWTTREIMDYDSFAAAMGPNSSMKTSFGKALRDAGADGFAVKSIHRNGKETVSMELVKAEKKSLPASLFEIPKGYKKEEGFGGMGMMPPEAKKEMEEALKGMSPDQREMMHRMMNNR